VRNSTPKRWPVRFRMMLVTCSFGRVWESTSIRSPGNFGVQRHTALAEERAAAKIHVANVDAIQRPPCRLSVTKRDLA
jgi:hypothetical protein